jgi:hypothetical protein
VASGDYREYSNSSGKGSDMYLVDESSNDEKCPLVGQSYKLVRFEVGLLGDLLGKELSSSRSVVYSLFLTIQGKSTGS